MQIIEDIRRLAKKNLHDGFHSVTLVLRRSAAPEGITVMLCGTHGPRGEVINAFQDGGVWRVVARFRCDPVIRFCDRAERILKAS
jgi:hypothetical protein